MSEDDSIQYLGTRRANLAPPNHSIFSTPPQRTIIGIELRVESNGAEEGHTLVFHKSDQQLVHVGRRPGSDSDKSKTESGRASFNCPVVSRHHAKIVFSDTGLCYLIDTHSHHGTHIRKANDTVLKALAPETPAVLSAGDAITFGKPVSSDKGLVQPIVAHVDLLYGQPQLKPLFVPEPGAGQHKLSLGPPSGRFGLYASILSEDDSSSSDGRDSPVSDSRDSDVEEIEIKPSTPSSAGHPPWRRSSWDFSTAWPVSRPSMLKQFLGSFSHCSPFTSPQPPAIEGQDPVVLDNSVDDHSYHNNSSEDEEAGAESRYASPMDLSSSPEPEAAPEGQDIVVAGEPLVVGAWPHSRSSSPAAFGQISFAEEMCGRDQSDDARADDREDIIEIIDCEPEARSENIQINQLQESLAATKEEVSQLQAYRRKFKERFSENVKASIGRFSKLEERTAENEDLYNALAERVDVQEETCRLVQELNDSLQLQVEEQALDFRRAEAAWTEKVEVAERRAAALSAELAKLREETRTELAEEVRQIRDAQEQLEAGLKRKRDFDDDAGDVPRKRVHRVTEVFARTATAVTIGAVVTWSALAFS